MNEITLTTFYIVRHGETDWNVKHLVQGHSNIPLNLNGEEQARILAKELKHINFDLAFSSDLLRAKRTAEIVALEHKLEVEVTKLLRERNYGHHEVKSGPNAQGFYSSLIKKLGVKDIDRFSYKVGGDIESDEEIVTRMITFLRETAITYPGKTVLVGTHGGIMRAFLIHLGAFGYGDTVHVKNTAYVKIESDGVDFFVREMKGIERS